MTRRWSSGRLFLEAGAALVAFSRCYPPTISTSNGSRATVQQWGIYIADAVAKTVKSGPFPTPLFRPSKSTIFHSIISTPRPPHPMPGNAPDMSPPHTLGNLRAMLSHHRVLAYPSNRDVLWARRGASPTWLDSHQSVGAAWASRSQPVLSGICAGMEKIRLSLPSRRIHR